MARTDMLSCPAQMRQVETYASDLSRLLRCGQGLQPERGEKLLLQTKRQRPQTQMQNLPARVHGGGQRMFSSKLFITLACLCLGILLVACGTSGGTTGGSGATPTKVVVQQCGTVHTDPRGIIADTSAAKAVEDCFFQAYQQCRPATLNYSLVSLDTGVDRTFTVKSANGQCSVTDAVQHYVVPQKPGPAQVYTCSGVTQQADGLHFSSCGQDGDIIVPDTSTPVHA